MKTHLIGILLGTLTCVLNVLAVGTLSTGTKTESVKPVSSVVAPANTEVRILEKRELTAEFLLLQAAFGDARRFWKNIGKDVYSEIEFLEITLDGDPSSSAYKIRIKLIPNKKSAFDASPQVFYAESEPGNKTLAWNVEEETVAQPEISNARFVFKKTDPSFREIRPDVFLAE